MSKIKVAEIMSQTMSHVTEKYFYNIIEFNHIVKLTEHNKVERALIFSQKSFFWRKMNNLKYHFKQE